MLLIVICWEYIQSYASSVRLASTGWLKKGKSLPTCE